MHREYVAVAGHGAWLAVLFFSENTGRLWHSIQIFSYRDSLHEKSKPILWEKSGKISVCGLLNLPREW